MADTDDRGSHDRHRYNLTRRADSRTAARSEGVSERAPSDRRLTQHCSRTRPPKDVGLSLDGSAPQHPNWPLYNMLSRGAGDVRSRIDVRPMPVVSVRPAVSQVPAPAGHRVRRLPFDGRVLATAGVWRSPTATLAAA